MTDIRELARVLKAVSEPDAGAAVKRKAEQLMAEATPEEVSRAEQLLLQEGMAPEDLRAACDIHLALMNQANAPLRAGLPAGHVLDTLYKEHVEILEFLRRLDEVAARLATRETHDPADPDHALLRHLAAHLVSAEKHHAREEDVLFPELEKRGIDGPPRIMRLEHNEFRPRKHRLLELAEELGGANGKITPAGPAFIARRDEAVELARFIVFNLREHIFKEDNILYPTALQAIQDERLWADLKRRCDAIGYCCFSPAA